MPFTLQDIPGVMRREGWPVGAALMDRWFAAPARTMSAAEKSGTTASSDVETRLVTMRWSMGFQRVATAHSELVGTWSSANRLRAAQSVLNRRVSAWRGANGGGSSFRFGDLSRPTAQVDAECQVNIQVVDSSIFASVDDFYAAMGRCLLKIAVTGMVTVTGPGRARLVIDEIGTYIRDTYDFIGDQGLGSWGPNGILRTAVLAPDIQVVRATAKDNPSQAYWSVSNKSYRDWRAHYGRGGDFVILSDIKRTKLANPVTVELTI